MPPPYQKFGATAWKASVPPSKQPGSSSIRTPVSSSPGLRSSPARPPVHKGASKKPPATSLPPGLIHLPARHNLSTSTVHNISQLGHSSSARDILEACCKSNDTIHHRIDPLQLSFFAAVNTSPAIPWRLPAGVKPSLPWHKAFLLTQISLCSTTATPTNITVGARKLLAAEKRLDEPVTELLQVVGVGPKKAEALAAAGVRSTRRFAELDSSHIERLLKRQPPFGESMRRTLAQFPRLTLVLRQCGWQQQTRGGSATDGTAAALAVVEATLGMENEGTPRWQGRVLRLVFWGGVAEKSGSLAFFWRGRIAAIEESRCKGDADAAGLVVRFTVEAGVGQSLACSFACEEVAGTVVKCTLKLV
ncbi:uncharacterized protein BROUX77_007450 [Berkeleyomyces rouxiae]|uniref:uncharacterized protein n=1 Tax=Berkeleyomyces rouxiae TaxID=2035830 RepID=UPI003B767191